MNTETGNQSLIIPHTNQIHNTSIQKGKENTEELKDVFNSEKMSTPESPEETHFSSE